MIKNNKKCIVISKKICIMVSSGYGGNANEFKKFDSRRVRSNVV